ncbi:MAG: gfo/Idh/MocA family oxidoreductase, partial [Clostridia bacterium]
MILAKSCHDMDILLWLSGHHCESVSSIGSLYEFKAERAPQGSAMRCYDGCKVRDTCPYDAEKIYITGPIGIIADPKVGWPQTVVCDNPTVETLTEALKTGPYGRCVYHCDNNVVDHQSVNMRMDNNMTVSF